MMESALSQGQIDVVKFDMLPQFAANAGYKHLSQFPGSTSLAISDRETGPAELGEDPSYTISSERNQRTGEYGFTFDPYLYICWPSLEIRYLLKFQDGSSPDAAISFLYKGLALLPRTLEVANIGKLTPYSVEQNSATSSSLEYS